MIEFQNNYLKRIEEARVVERRIDVFFWCFVLISYLLLIRKMSMMRTRMENLESIV